MLEGTIVRYPEIHPLAPEMVKSMRAYAENDRYHGATWETIVTLCDEVDLQRTQIEKLKAKIQELEKEKQQ